MRILGIIPARGGSKGVPKKNSKLLGGKPLIAYTLEAAKACKLITHVIVSTDDDDIIQIAQTYNIDVPFKRPLKLATDESPTIFTVIHAVEHFKLQGVDFDAVCLLQVTNPFRTAAFIDTAIQKFIAAKTDSLVSVLEVPHELNPHWVFEKTAQDTLVISTGETKIITRRQELPTCYYRDGAIYITKTNVLLEQKSLYGTTISYCVSDKNRHINIDTPDDWEQAEVMVKKIVKN